MIINLFMYYLNLPEDVTLGGGDNARAAPAANLHSYVNC